MDQGGLVFAVVDLVAQAFCAFDDGADGGVDEASGVQTHCDAIAHGVLPWRGVRLFLWRHEEERNVRRAGQRLQAQGASSFSDPPNGFILSSRIPTLTEFGVPSCNIF